METVTAVAAPRLGGPGLRLLLAATVSRLVGEAAGVAVVLVVVARTDDPRLAGLVVAAFALPTLVTGPLLGALVDRLRAKRLLFLANQVLMAAALTGLLLLIGRAPGVVLIGLGLLAGVTAPVLTGGYSGVLPRVVPAGGMPRANAADAASYTVAGLAGPACVAAVAAGLGSDAALAGTAGLAGAAIALVAAAPMPPPAALTVREPLRAALADGLRLLWRVPQLRRTTVATTTGYAAQGLLPVSVPLLAIALGEPAAHGGWLLTGISAGALAGAVASERLLARFDPMPVLVGALGGTGLGFAAVSAAPALPVAVLLSVLTGVASGPLLAATLTVRQRCTPPERYAQVVATAASIKTGAYALGAATTGLLAAHLGPRQLLLAVAAGQAVALVPLLWPARRSVPPPAGPGSVRPDAREHAVAGRQAEFPG